MQRRGSQWPPASGNGRGRISGALQPKLKELQKKYKNNRQKQQEAAADEPAPALIPTAMIDGVGTSTAAAKRERRRQRRRTRPHGRAR